MRPTTFTFRDPRTGVALGDVDGDGDLDVGLRTGELFLRGPGATYTAAPTPIAPEYLFFALDFGDVDGDGVVDALIAGQSETRLARGLGGGRFDTPIVTALAACDQGSATMLTPTDADLDGVRDFWAACGIGDSRPSVLMRGLGDGHFERTVWPAMSPQNPQASGLPVFGMLSEDLDDDGVVDAMLLSDSYTGWFAWATPGAPTSYPLDLPLTAVEHQLNTMSSVSLDFDRDGLLDLFWTGGQTNRMLRHRGGRTFDLLQLPVGTAVVSSFLVGWSAVAFDADLDGWTDVLALRLDGSPSEPRGEQPARPGLYVNQHDGTFADLSADAAPVFMQGYQAACGDLDGDGRVGCVVTEFNRVVTLENRLETSGGWVGVRLRGTVSDPEGIGAIVSVEGLDRPQVRRVGPEAATYARHDLGLVLPALGQPTLALRVRWPSGLVQRVASVPAGRYTTIVEPAALTLARRVAPADGLTQVEVTVSPALVGASAATIEARGAVAWAGETRTVDGVLRRNLVAPSSPGNVTLDVSLDGVALRVHPQVRFQ